MFDKIPRFSAFVSKDWQKVDDIPLYRVRMDIDGTIYWLEGVFSKEQIQRDFELFQINVCLT